MSETQLQAVSIEDGEKEEIKIADDDPRGIWQHLRLYLKVAINFFDLDSPWGYGAFLTAYMIVIFVHPFLYYAYVIDSQHNCLEINNELYATFAVVAFFNTYMLLYVPNVIRKIFLGTMRKEKGIEHFMFTQVPVLLMTLTILPDLTRGTTDKIFVTTTNLFLFGYILLVIGLSITIRNASKQIGFIAKAKWAKAVLNLLLYLHGGHVFGATWYCFAIDRILVCWRDEYISKNTLKFSTFVCGNHNSQKLSCHKTGNVTHFGIFNGALEYRIVGMKPFLKKYLFCLRWGLQVLSCFGQNLQPSTVPLENIYVISVIIYSTLLFVFLIGNMQTYLQSASERPEDIVNNKKMEELLKWLEKTYPQSASERPEDIVNNMKMEERLEWLKKVEELREWGDAKLERLCTRMKPAFYGDRTLVIREGEPISEILFVLQGNLWTYTKNGENFSLGEGAFIGTELVSQIQAAILPTSTGTIRTLRHVEAIAITAYDLKDVFNNEPPEIRPRSPLKKCSLTGFFRSRNRENL